MPEKIDSFKKIGELVQEYFQIALNDLPIPDIELVDIEPDRGDALLIGSKKALKYQYLVQGDIKPFLDKAPEGYFLIGFWGHGLNSHGFNYSIVDSNSRIFFRLPYGGAYMNNKREAIRIKDFLLKFSDFKNKLNDATTFNIVESMGEGSYEIKYKDQEVKFKGSIYSLKDREKQFQKILKSLKVPIKPQRHNIKLHSWVGKKFEDMTPKEQDEYREHLRRKFTWEPGDLVKIGHEPLTDEEKALVESIKKADEEEDVTDSIMR
jgi:hypothetical protein